MAVGRNYLRATSGKGRVLMMIRKRWALLRTLMESMYLCWSERQRLGRSETQDLAPDRRGLCQEDGSHRT